MKLIEMKCAMCGSSIYVYESYAREEMFCTLQCLERSTYSKIGNYADQIKSSC
ncbi:MAG: hypothetical protein R2741_15560 [Methanolobus sp.]